MSYFRHGDPEDDFDRWDAEQARQLAQLPKCEYCEEPIQDEHYFDVHGEILCEECMNDLFRKGVDQYGE